MVTADLVGLYPGIPHEAEVKALEKALNNVTNKRVLTEDLVKMAKFVLKNNYFEFNRKVKEQILGTAIGTKFAPPYACIFMDEVETSFLETQEMKPLVWFQNIDMCLLFGPRDKRNLIHFLQNLIDVTLILTLHMSQVKLAFHFLILN